MTSQKIEERRPGMSPASGVQRPDLGRGEDDADDQAEQGHALDERGGDDHRGTEVAGGFGLTSSAFERRSGEAADAETGAEGNETSAETGTEVSKGSGIHDEAC